MCDKCENKQTGQGCRELKAASGIKPNVMLNLSHASVEICTWAFTVFSQKLAFVSTANLEKHL